MNFCTTTVDALCFHLADGVHLTGTLAQPSFYNLHSFCQWQKVSELDALPVLR